MGGKGDGMSLFKLNKGFTLIELIMVITIIGILAAMAIPKFVNFRRDAQKATCYGNAGVIQSALSTYYMKEGADDEAGFPDSLYNTTFLTYIVGSTLPTHPIGRDWNNYYSALAGGESYSFLVGKGNSSGACTEF